MAALGFLVFMGAAVSLALARGRPLAREEVDEMEGRRLTGWPRPAFRRGAVYRTAGAAVGAGATDEASFAEVKAAWRARAWRGSPRWRRLFVWMAGTALLVVGGFGIGIVLAPAGIKLLLAAALGYAAVRTAAGLARA
jgi:hypothetical protein